MGAPTNTASFPMTVLLRTAENPRLNHGGSATGKLELMTTCMYAKYAV